MDQSTILIIGGFIFILLAVGAALTIDEFRKMEEDPDKYLAAEDEEQQKEDK